MEEYKPNSFRSKERPTEIVAERKVAPVVSGGAKTVKKRGFGKLADVFLQKDVGDVKRYVWDDIITPFIKKALMDVLRFSLYGETGGESRGAVAPKASYRKYYDQRSDEHVRTPRATGGFAYDDILFPSRGDAEEVLASMEEMIDDVGTASVADMYDLADVSLSGYYTANKYGWTDLSTARVMRTINGDGYILKLPRATAL